MASQKRYIVTGAGGHLGSTLLRLLCERECEIFALLLPGEKPAVEHPRIRYFYGDVCDAQTLCPLFENAEGREVFVFHTAALISIARKVPPRLYAVNVQGTKNVLRLCRAYGVKRLVHVSSVHAIPELPKWQTMTEVDSFSAARVCGGYAKTKAEAAQAVCDAAAAGLDVVTVFPSGILGPYDQGRNHLIQMTEDYLRGRLPACVKGGYDFVDVRDVAQGCILAMERGTKGEGYILSGYYYSLSELLACAGKICGHKAIPALPVALAHLAVPFVALHAQCRHTRPLYTDYSLHTITSNSRYSHEKASRALGYTVRPKEETIRDMVGWLEKKKPE